MSFLSENFQFFGGEIFYVFEKACFRNVFLTYCFAVRNFDFSLPTSDLTLSSNSNL